MYKNLTSKSDQATAQSFPFGETLWQLFLQYINIFMKPSINTLNEVMETASWWLVLVQFLSLIIIMGTISFLGLALPSATLHSIATLSIGFVRPLEWLPFPLNEITLVFASFFIGLGTAYGGSKACGGQGTFLAHFYCLLICTIPLVTVSGALLLIPATGWLLQALGGIVCALFIYRLVLHTITIMAVHRLRAAHAIIIVLILPIAILVVIVFVGVLMHGEGIGDLCGDFFDIGDGIGNGRRCRKGANDSAMR